MAGSIAELDTSLAIHLITTYGTLVLPGYHLHLADGPKVCRQLTIDTLAVVTAATIRYQPFWKITKSKKKSIDIGGATWRLLELLVDRLPRRLRNRLGSGPKTRLAIDTMIEWKKHRYDSPKRIPVAIISPEQIS